MKEHLAPIGVGVVHLIHPQVRVLEGWGNEVAGSPQPLDILAGQLGFAFHGNILGHGGMDQAALPNEPLNLIGAFLITLRGMGDVGSWRGFPRRDRLHDGREGGLRWKWMLLHGFGCLSDGFVTLLQLDRFRVLPWLEHPKASEHGCSNQGGAERPLGLEGVSCIHRFASSHWYWRIPLRFRDVTNFVEIRGFSM